jgi:hypothetical protein
VTPSREGGFAVDGVDRRGSECILGTAFTRQNLQSGHHSEIFVV